MRVFVISTIKEHSKESFDEKWK